jgi:hypothetical protein
MNTKVYDKLQTKPLENTQVKHNRVKVKLITNSDINGLTNIKLNFTKKLFFLGSDS